MANRVFVTGIGIIAAIGNHTEEALQSLTQKRSGIVKGTTLDTIFKDNIPFGEIKLSNKVLAEKLNIPSSNSYTRTALLAMTSAKEALVHAQIKDIRNARTGLISATSVGGMDRSEQFFKEYHQDKNKGRLRDIVGHDCGDHTEKIADFLGINDYMTTLSTACSSSANAIIAGSRMIKNQILDRVIIGGADSLTKFTMNGFNSLMIFDRNFCRPFDETRFGLNLGEGAAYLVLESEKMLEREPRKILCEVKGFGNASDAYHQTASSPDGFGACLAMRKALESAQLKPSDIDYINAHGTGTPNNDLSEGKAIENVFQDMLPLFSSTKAYTGHTLGATGAIEAVLCVLAIQHGLIYPNLNFTTPMKELAIRPVTELITNAKVDHVLSNSFGFGGNNTSLIFSKIYN